MAFKKITAEINGGLWALGGRISSQRKHPAILRYSRCDFLYVKAVVRETRILSILQQQSGKFLLSYYFNIIPNFSDMSILFARKEAEISSSLFMNFINAYSGAVFLGGKNFAAKKFFLRRSMFRTERGEKNRQSEICEIGRFLPIFSFP